MNMLEVNNTVEEMSKRTNDYTKIELLCWQYHSNSRIANGNEPFTFSNYSHAIDKHTMLSYIEFNLIDVSSIGTKEHCTEIVRRW